MSKNTESGKPTFDEKFHLVMMKISAWIIGFGTLCMTVVAVFSYGYVLSSKTGEVDVYDSFAAFLANLFATIGFFIWKELRYDIRIETAEVEKMNKSTDPGNMTSKEKFMIIFYGTATAMSVICGIALMIMSGFVYIPKVFGANGGLTETDQIKALAAAFIAAMLIYIYKKSSEGFHFARTDAEMRIKRKKEQRRY